MTGSRREREMFDQKKAHDAAVQILPSYRRTLGEDCTLRPLYFSENMTYLVQNRTKEAKAILRLSRPGYHTAEELAAELCWMRELARDTALCVRQPVSGDDGREIYEGYAGGEPCYGVVFTYLPGDTLEQIPLAEQEPWFEKIGQAAAVLHGHARSRSGARPLKRIRWNYDTMLGRRAVWGDWRRNTVWDEEMRRVLTEADDSIRRKLAAYGTAADRYGLIHADLRAANLLTAGGGLQIIDFDDCGYGWYMQDFAASLSFLETAPEMPRLAAAWCRGYRAGAVLRGEDLEMLPVFLMMRRLQLTAWAADRAGNDEMAKLPPDFARGTAELAERYLRGTLLPLP